MVLDSCKSDLLNASHEIGCIISNLHVNVAFDNMTKSFFDSEAASEGSSA